MALPERVFNDGEAQPSEDSIIQIWMCTGCNQAFLPSGFISVPVTDIGPAVRFFVCQPCLASYVGLKATVASYLLTFGHTRRLP